MSVWRGCGGTGRFPHYKERGPKASDAHAATFNEAGGKTQAASWPLRTALSMVAGQPVSVHAPARATFGRLVAKPGLSLAVPGLAANVAAGSRLTLDQRSSA